MPAKQDNLPSVFQITLYYVGDATRSWIKWSAEPTRMNFSVYATFRSEDRNHRRRQAYRIDDVIPHTPLPSLTRNEALALRDAIKMALEHTLMYPVANFGPDRVQGVEVA